MGTLDFHDLSATTRYMIDGLHQRKISGPLYVDRDGEQLAVIIRSEAYAPRLHEFTQNADGHLVCGLCTPSGAVIGPKPTNLADALDTANRHYVAYHHTRPNRNR